VAQQLTNRHRRGKIPVWVVGQVFDYRILEF
jgi:hypothetical protein